MGVIVDIKHIRLEPVDNGFVLDYTEVVEKPGTFEDRDWTDRKLVFGEEDLDSAMAKMKELLLFKKTKKGAITAPSPNVAMKSHS